MNGFTKTLLVLVLFAAIVASGGGLLAMQFLKTPASSSDETVIFEVKPGEAFKTVARRLEEQGLVSSAWKLEILARFTKNGSKVRVGEYAMRRDSKPREVLTTLNLGRSIEYSITVQEGFNRFEIADALAKSNLIKRDEFLALTTDRALIRELLNQEYASLEGYLFPETYHITKFTGARGLIKMMVDRYKENFAKAKAISGWNAVGLNDRQLIILASIIEKETGAPEERPVISSVFHNRLRIKMPLQTDPTIIYGLWQETGAWNRNLSRADLQAPNPYNSYLNLGLPPGPISNPGFDAIKAAGAPATTEFLFFVSRNNGTHIFSKDYAQHQRAVTQFQIDRKAREGKSWRDLKKREAVPEQVIDSLPSAPKAPPAAVAPATKPPAPVSIKPPAPAPKANPSKGAQP